MQIEIYDDTLTGKLKRIAQLDGVPVEKVAVDLLSSALAEGTREKMDSVASAWRKVLSVAGQARIPQKKAHGFS